MSAQKCTTWNISFLNKNGSITTYCKKSLNLSKLIQEQSVHIQDIIEIKIKKNNVLWNKITLQSDASWSNGLTIEMDETLVTQKYKYRGRK
eukprot:246785_1